MIKLDFQTATDEEREFIHDVFLHLKLKGAYHSKGQSFHELGAIKKYWTRRLRVVRITPYTNYAGGRVDETKAIVLANGQDMTKHYVRITVPIELFKEKTL
jgi:hypothetical protein